jgi:hypothetical protein
MKNIVHWDAKPCILVEVASDYCAAYPEDGCFS